MRHGGFSLAQARLDARLGARLPLGLQTPVSGHSRCCTVANSSQPMLAPELALATVRVRCWLASQALVQFVHALHAVNTQGRAETEVVEDGMVGCVLELRRRRGRVQGLVLTVFTSRHRAYHV